MVNSVGNTLHSIPVIQRCMDRFPACTLLLAVAFGRHFYRQLSELMPDAVCRTHAGTSASPTGCLFNSVERGGEGNRKFGRPLRGCTEAE